MSSWTGNDAGAIRPPVGAAVRWPVRVAVLAALAALTGLALASLYRYGRFTVDDAFITWRYGRNLIEFGIWGYNPTAFDLTQAYTNPIMAALSILPAALSIDMVLFFKLFSIANLGLLVAVLLRLSRDRVLTGVLLAAFVAMPASVIHLASGLETFLFVSLLGLLFVALDRARRWPATGLALALIFTRPEAWLLVALVPGHFLVTSLVRDRGGLRPAVRAAAGPALVLGGAFAAYALFHWLHFGSVLPNTFYVKSGGSFSMDGFWSQLVFALPLLVPLILGRLPASLFALVFVSAVAANYASAELTMNYSNRFAFHIFAPCYLYAAYALATEPRRLHLSLSESFERHLALPLRWIGGAMALTLLLLFHRDTHSPNEAAHLQNYYPRSMNAHVALGNALDQIGQRAEIDRFSLGDAGVAAFHSRLVAFDNIGLGSSLLARTGMSAEVIDAYDPDIVVFHARNGEIRLSNFNQELMLAWARDRNYSVICELFWAPYYTLLIYAAQRHPDIEAICIASKAINNVTNAEFMKTRDGQPPWVWWRE